jgi:hypothetical protein
MVWITYRKSQEDPENTGNISISGVERGEFAHLFASALLDDRGRQVLLGLMRASGRNFTPREALFLKYTLGQIDKDSFATEIDRIAAEWNAQDRAVYLKQIEVMKTTLTAADEAGT